MSDIERKSDNQEKSIDARHGDHQKEKGTRAPFEVRDNCLYVTTVSKRGSSTTKV